MQQNKYRTVIMRTQDSVTIVGSCKTELTILTQNGLIGGMDSYSYKVDTT